MYSNRTGIVLNLTMPTPTCITTSWWTASIKPRLLFSTVQAVLPGGFTFYEFNLPLYVVKSNMWEIIELMLWKHQESLTCGVENTLLKSSKTPRDTCLCFIVTKWGNVLFSITKYKSIIFVRSFRHFIHIKLL